MFIMGKEPTPDITIEKAYELYAAANKEYKIADVYAIVSNAFWWTAFDIDDYEVGSEEYKEAVLITDKWRELYSCIEKDIFKILESEGKIIPNVGLIVVLEPFMKRNGYRNENGWWVEEYKLAVKLGKKLKEIYNNNDFVSTILTYADNEEMQQAILDFIEAGEDVSEETISVLAMDLADKQEE